MQTPYFPDFSGFSPANNLWPQLVAKLGVEKSQHAVRQALDLQRMHGDIGTIPVLLSGTCGIALANIELLHLQTGFSKNIEGMVLIVDIKSKFLQLLKEV